MYYIIILVLYDFNSEIQLQRPMYRVPENISLDRLVLKVCVEGADLEDKVYDVQIKTEQASTCFAIGKHLLSCVYSWHCYYWLMANCGVAHICMIV